MSIEKAMEKLMKTGLIEKYYIRRITAITCDIIFYFNFNGRSFCFCIRDFPIEEVPYNILLNAITGTLHNFIDRFFKD